MLRTAYMVSMRRSSSSLTLLMSNSLNSIAYGTLCDTRAAQRHQDDLEARLVVPLEDYGSVARSGGVNRRASAYLMLLCEGDNGELSELLGLHGTQVGVLGPVACSHPAR